MKPIEFFKRYLAKLKYKIVLYLRSKKFKIFLWVLFSALLLCYIVLFVFAREIETFFTFPGKDVNLKQLSNHPAGIISAQEYNIPSSGGNNINGIFIDNGKKKTVYYFHGNGAPMDHFYTEMQYIADLGYNLMSYDFPGYWKSEGSPTQLENLNFSHEFYKAMKKEKWLKDEDLIIWWYSIGTAVAIDFAKDVEFDKLVLFSPLASRYDMSVKWFWFPIQKLFFLPNSYVSKETIKYISNPTLIIHGNNDIVVPFEQWQEVFNNSIAQEKYFIEVDDFGHSLITERYWEVLSWYIKEFLWGEQLDEKKTFLSRELATKLLWKFKLQSYLNNLNISGDDSLTKYVDPDVAFKEAWYIPENMRSLQRDYIIDAKWDAQLVQQAADDFEKMAEAFYNEFEEKITVVSSYRSYSYQAGIKARWCPDSLCAKAGHSEHQSGLGIDLWSASNQGYWNNSARLTKFYKWLTENAHLYGFHNTYQNWREIDGYEVEPWHWRYVGVKFATYLKQEDITFAEFYYWRNKG